MIDEIDAQIARLRKNRDNAQRLRLEPMFLFLGSNVYRELESAKALYVEDDRICYAGLPIIRVSGHPYFMYVS